MTNYLSRKGAAVLPGAIGKRLELGLVAVVVAVLSGCTTPEHSQLRQDIQAVKAKKGGRIEPVPAFKTYETYEYGASNLRDPFKMFDSEADIKEEATSTSDIMPDLDRNKETLESYPLDTLKFVGTLEKDGRQWAIVTSPDNLVHRVKIGNHLGTNYGEIVSISETKIKLIEIIRDGMGGWIEREAALSLIE